MSCVLEDVQENLAVRYLSLFGGKILVQRHLAIEDRSRNVLEPFTAKAGVGRGSLV